MITVAQIGVGKWGKNIVSTLETIPAVRLKYLSARTGASLSPYAQKYEKLTDWRGLLSKKDIDAVIIATPPASHAEISVPFLERGIPVFIEKPMALNVLDAERIVTAAAKGKTEVFVGHIHLYNPAYIKAKEALRHCGAITHIHTTAGNNGPFRDDYSVVWDWAPHDVSAILDLLGKNPVSVQAWGFSLLRPETLLYDIAHLKLSFPGGVFATIRVSWLEALKSKKVTVVAGESVVSFDDARAENKVRVSRDFLPSIKSAQQPSTLTRREPEVSYPSYSEKRPLTAELEAFVQCVSRKQKPRTDALQGLAVVRILEAAERSIGGGGEAVSLKDPVAK